MIDNDDRELARLDSILPAMPLPKLHCRVLAERRRLLYRPPGERNDDVAEHFGPSQ
jgi:hypothetical protein